MDIAAIGKRLLDVRQKHGYSQRRVAAVLNISDGSYKNYENGHRELPLSTAVLFCEAFDEDLLWLISGEPLGSAEPVIDVFEEAVRTVVAELEATGKSLSPDKLSKACSFLTRMSLKERTSPKDNVGQIMELIA